MIKYSLHDSWSKSMINNFFFYIVQCAIEIEM